MIPMSGWVSVGIVAAATVALLVLPKLVVGTIPTTANPIVWRHLRYQGAALAVAAVTLLLIRLLVRPEVNYLRVGDLHQPATGLRLLGVTSTDTWVQVGTSFAIIATVVTTLVIWLQLSRDQRPSVRQLPRAMLLALPISVSNAAVEELIYRVGLGEALSGVASPTVIALVSAVLFGLPHWFGNPAKLPGVLLAGFLGWLMCQSMLQTGGIAWAFGIHALQDVAILTILIAAGRPKGFTESHQ